MTYLDDLEKYLLKAHIKMEDCAHYESSDEKYLNFTRNKDCEWCKVLSSEKVSRFFKYNANKYKELHEEMELLRKNNAQLNEIILKLKSENYHQEKQSQTAEDDRCEASGVDLRDAHRVKAVLGNKVLRIDRIEISPENHNAKATPIPVDCKMCKGTKNIVMHFDSAMKKECICPYCKGTGKSEEFLSLSIDKIVTHNAVHLALRGLTIRDILYVSSDGLKEIFRRFLAESFLAESGKYSLEEFNDLMHKMLKALQDALAWYGLKLKE